MKILPSGPSVPPYLHLGSSWLSLKGLATQHANTLGQLDTEWRKLSAKLIAQPKMLRRIFERLEARSVDPDYDEEKFEVFCTLTDDSQGCFRLDFYY